jgi:hypothetical protein
LGYYSATGTSIGCDANITDNGSGQVLLPAGTGALPSVAIGQATTGIYQISSAHVDVVAAGSVIADFVVGAVNINHAGVYQFGATTAGSAQDTGVSRTAADVIALGNGTAADESALLRWNNCKPTAVTLNSASFTTFCSWTLPAVAKTWAFQCNGTYTLTAGTTPTLIIGFIAAQTPSAVAITSSIGSTLTGVSTQGTNTTANTSQQTVLTGTTNTQANAPFSIYGSVTASATSGTFILNAELGGSVSPAGTINFGSSCEIF